MKKAFVSGGAAGEQAFKSVTNALFSMDDKVQQNLLGVQLFGTMWEDLGVEGVKALSDLDGEFNRVHDTMSEIKNIKYDDLGSAFEGLKRLLTVKLLLPISEELTPAVSDFINNLRASFEDGALSGAVTALSTGIVSGLRGIGGVAKNVFSAFSTAIENNGPAIDNLKTAFGNVKDAISNAFSGDSSGFITKLADTIVPIACNALSTLMNTASGVANFFVNNFDSLKPILKGVLSGFLAYKSMSGINNVFNTVKVSINGLKGAFKAAKSATGIIKSVKAFGTALSGIKGIIGGVGSAITFLTSPVGLIVVAIGAAIAIGVALYKNWDTIKAKAQDLCNAIATKFPAVGKVFGALKDTVSEKLSNIKQAYEEHGGGLKGIAFGAFEAVKGCYTAGFTFIDKLTGGKLSAITSKIGEKFAGIKNIAGTVFGAVKDTVSEKLLNIKQAYEEHGGGLKGIAFGAFEAVKGYYTSGFTFIDKLTGGKLSAITSKIEEKFAGVKDVAGKAFGVLKDTVSEKLSNIKQAYEEHGGGLMGISAGIWEGIKGYYTVGYDFINNLTGGKLESIKISITSKMSTIKDAIGQKWDEIKTGASEKWESIKSTIYNKASGIWSSISGVFDNIKNGIVDKIQWAKDKVAGIVQGFKDLFNFEWKLPKLKIPSIEKTGAKNIMGFEVPTFGIKWNAKGGILTKPTIFGQSGNTLLGGGEAGAEAVLPLTQFWNKLRTFVNENKEQSPTVIHKHENQINIHVYATDKSADEIVHEIVPKLKLAIENM